jgi:hypothetical protein
VGFSLLAIATLVTANDPPRLVGWAIGAFTVTVAVLLFSMQVAFLSLNRNSSPADILSWRPEATVSVHELQLARAAQAAGFREMKRLGKISFRAYHLGVVAFLIALLFLVIPKTWSGGRIAGVVAVASVLSLELWWALANKRWLPHPVERPVRPTHGASWNGFDRKDPDPPPLDRVGLSAVLKNGDAAAIDPSPFKVGDRVVAPTLPGGADRRPGTVNSVNCLVIEFDDPPVKRWAHGEEVTPLDT